MKKILFISYDGMTDPLGQSQVIPYLAGLTREGYQFTVLSFEKEKSFKDRGAHIAALMKQYGIQWRPEKFHYTTPFISKIKDQLRMNSMAAKLYRLEKFDLIHCRSYVAAEAGMKLFKAYGVPFLFDMRGFWVDERVDNGQWNLQNPVYRLLYTKFKKREKRYLSCSAHIISLTHKGKDELVEHYKVKADRISVIPCCVDLDHFDYKKIKPRQQDELKQQLGLKAGEKLITYLGSLGGWYMTGEMLELFSAMRSSVSDLRFLFITHDSRESVLTKSREKGIEDNAIIVKAATRNEVPLYLSLSDWSVFLIKDAYSKKASSPTKQGEIMAMGIPIICNDIGDTGKIVTEANAGYLVRDFSISSYEQVADKAITGMENNKERIRKEAFKYFDLNEGIKKYKTVYSSIFKEGK